MNAKPIIFSGPMVRALRDGRKTMTRRMVKPKPYQAADGRWCLATRAGFQPLDRLGCEFLSPYGQPGDLLWVREAWGVLFPQHINDAENEPTWYRADDPNGLPKWRPSIHMPRARSRLTLRITDVRAERLQEISEEGARAEGVFRTESLGGCLSYRGAEGGEWHVASRNAFRDLWESINGQGAWDENPWVWAIRFDVIRANVDDVTRDVA